MKKQAHILFLLIACLLFYTGCTPVGEPAMKAHVLNQSLENLQLLGRSYATPEGITCDFTASGISFRVTTGGKVFLHVFSDRTAYFSVFIDGVRCDTRFTAAEGASVLEIANFAEVGTHHIRIVKQTEASLALCHLRALSFSGRFESPPTQSPLYIEVLGDSIICGCGNLCDIGTPQPEEAIYEDGTAAFPFLTAEALQADCSIIGCSGIGIANSFTGFTLKDFYHKQCYFRPNSPTYFPSRTPNLIIINVGTNDETRNADPLKVTEKTKDLILSLRQLYAKDVPIIFTHNMMQDGMYTSLQKALSDLGEEASGLYLCRLNRNNGGGGGHPDIEGHQAAAQILIQYIRDKKILNID